MWKLVAAIVTVGLVTAPQEVTNLLVNGDAGQGLAGWLPSGNATIEGDGAAAHFVVRNQGMFQQIVPLPPSAPGQVLVLVTRGSSERVNADGAITGLPSLYGLIVGSQPGRILAHLQGPQTLGRPPAPNTWVTMSGAFAIPLDATRVTVQLGQATRAGVPQNGSAARFDDVGVYVLPSAQQAAALIADWPKPALFYPPPSLPPTPPTRAITSRLEVVLSPPADPAIVAPFRPEWGVVLPEQEGFKAAQPCSRRSPGTIESVWTPDAVTIVRVDAVLPVVLQGALNRSPRESARKLSSGDYHRQYVGIVVNGRRLVHVNGFRFPETLQPTWRTALQRGCDGGESFFGAEFDPASGEVIGLAFNASLNGR